MNSFLPPSPHQAFFSDPDRFNPDELARFQPGNGELGDVLPPALCPCHALHQGLPYCNDYIQLGRAPLSHCPSQLHTLTCSSHSPCRPCHLRGCPCPSALELQALGRERESRLQLAEYQLRLAQEDLREMQRRLADKVCFSCDCRAQGCWAWVWRRRC